MGELGTKSVAPGRDTSALNHGPISPAPSSESLQVRDFLGENKSPVLRWAYSLNDSGFFAFLLTVLETPAVILAWSSLLSSKESHCAFPPAFIQEGHSLELNVPLKAQVCFESLVASLWCQYKVVSVSGSYITGVPTWATGSLLFVSFLPGHHGVSSFVPPCDTYHDAPS